MRRGGRTVYAFDVTTPTSPSVKWKIGCPYPQGNNTGCTAGMTGIGQTGPLGCRDERARPHGTGGHQWAAGRHLRGCEYGDPDLHESSRGRRVRDRRNTGAIVKTFSTTRSVVGDVALIAVANAAVVDHAYAADTAGTSTASTSPLR